jgi:hypothetical protein
VEPQLYMQPPTVTDALVKVATCISSRTQLSICNLVGTADEVSMRCLISRAHLRDGRVITCLSELSCAMTSCSL